MLYLGIVTVIFSIFLVQGNSKTPDLIDQKSCQEVRLDQNGGPFDGYKFQDQGDIGNCYAFMGAKLADAWRYSHETPGQKPDRRQSSGLALSMAYSASNPLASSLDGAFSCDILKYAYDNGGCDVEVIDNLFTSTDSLGNPIDQMLHQYDLYSKYESKDNDKAADKMATKICLRTNKILSDGNHINISDVMSALTEQTKTKFVYDLLVKDLCENTYNALPTNAPRRGGNDLQKRDCDFYPLSTYAPEFTRGIPAEESVTLAQQGTLNAINDALDSGRPAGLGICAGVLKGSPGGINWNESTSRSNYAADLGQCGGHAVVTIGKKWVKDHCEYLIFNSWEAKLGDQGKIWVRASDLAKSTMEVFQIIN